MLTPLTPLVAHDGLPPAPHDLWSAWNLDPLLLGAGAVAVLAYVRGRRPARREADRWRDRAAAGALGALALALVSPLEALSGALASAHMVQHLLLVVVAAPLIAVAAPGARIVRGTPPAARRALGRWQWRSGLTPRRLRALRHPAAVWLLHVGTLWMWHAAVPYGAALDSEVVHVAEHVTFLVTAVLFWQVVIGARAAGRVSPGVGVLVVFATSMQSVMLSLLLTFARSPWYDGYAGTTAAWGLTPLADQQLAGAIMWVPGGVVYVGVALALFLAWVRSGEAATGSPAPARA